jgi:6-phosphogluconate dehydrogenase
MDIGLVGLGKMGYALGLNMIDHGYSVAAYSRSSEKAAEFSSDGFNATSDFDDFIKKLKGRRVIWLMVPAGDPVDKVIDQLSPLLSEGDIIVDGGNSHYRDSTRRADDLRRKGIKYVDAGISGGPGGARQGPCMMVGADRDVFSYLEPLLKAVCLENGYLHVGENGAGHYVKMIHNGIEYGMMQAIAEGFEVLQNGPYEIDYPALARLWNNGSVIRSWLIELTGSLFEADPGLEKIKGVAGSSGTGRWTVEEAMARNVPVPVISQALFARYRSGLEENFAAKVIAGLRREFGGHDVKES